MKVTFLFCNPTQWWKQAGSWLIRVADKSPASHFAICIEHDSGREVVYESVFPKSMKSSIEEWMRHNSLVAAFGFDVPRGKEYLVHEFLEARLGIWYSVPQLILIALCLIKPLNKLLNWSILNHERALVCSEVGSRFLERFIEIQIKESHDKIGVRDMLEYTETLSTNGITWRDE
jgi:hypothetical protein